ncbi:charged multivesicular body protein 6 [Rhinoraja longicauda]
MPLLISRVVDNYKSDLQVLRLRSVGLSQCMRISPQPPAHTLSPPARAPLLSQPSPASGLTRARRPKPLSVAQRPGGPARSGRACGRPRDSGQRKWGNLFVRKKRSRVTEQDKAVLQLKQQRDKLKQYQKRIGIQLEKERELARVLLRGGKKEKAKLLLKKKRYQEQLLDKTEVQISNLEHMVQDIEFAQIEMKVIEGLKIGNDCLNKMHEVMSLEEAERIMDETQEAVEYQRQIDEILAGGLSQDDEDAILAELDAITQEEVELPEVPAEPLPNIPASQKDKEPFKNLQKPAMVAAS